jgi:ADP-ribosylglycohydrolase/protein-tyrosine phosphatase
MKPSRPLPNCYWLVEGRLLAGEYPGAPKRAEAERKLRRLCDSGVNAFIDLTEPGELEPYEALLSSAGAGACAYHRVPVRDLNVPSPEEMHRILDLLESEQARGRTVYLHCWGGVGRTGTVVGCYLVRQGLSGSEALDRLATLWQVMEKRDRIPQSPETEAQREFVLGWATHEARRNGSSRSIGTSRRTKEFYRGCLLGGAVGDALGAPVEFMKLPEIRAWFGPDGITEFAPAYGKLGAITDDTQMTLFTAEGLLRAKCRASHKGICSIEGVVHHAYLRWLRTQGGQPARELEPVDGWLFGLRELHDRRAPGNTCLSALSAVEPGSRQEPRNDSKGCGGVMRMAPAGLVQDADSFELGCDLAALTHGHPSGYLAAGAFAAMVRELIEGRSLLEAVEIAMGRLERCRSHEECTTALRAALEQWRSGAPSAERVARLGEGWVAEEALAIGVYCALAAGEDFAAGVRLAVNHGGDSDSTGAIAGNLLGAALGASVIPQRWLDTLELRTEIETLADDMLIWFRDDGAWWSKYPGS